MTSIIRGIRNNNPLNIIKSPAQWLGKVGGSYQLSHGINEKRTDPTFEQFTVPGQHYVPGNKDQRVYGYRAAIRLLRSYIQTRNRNTIDRIIFTWAPESDHNLPIQYANTVSKLTGIHRDTKLTFSEDTICHLVAAMAKVESAIPYNQDDALIRKAWQLQGV